MNAIAKSWLQIENVEKAGPSLLLYKARRSIQLGSPFQLSYRRDRPRHLRLGGGCRRPVVTPRSTVWISGGERGPSPSRWPLQAVLPIDVSYSGMKLYLSDH